MSTILTEYEMNEMRAMADYDDRQAEESFRFWEKQKVVCQREKQIGITCLYCEFKPFKVDLSIPF